MVPLPSILLLGFCLGLRHATDPDHVMAVTTIVSRERTVRGAALLGSLWGVGHTMTILLLGGAIILFGVVIPPRVGLTLELGVAVMLILLGGLHVSGVAQRRRVSAAAHARPLIIGVVHGLAGSAAAALLVLGAIRDARWAVAYLLIFGAGTVAGMMLITTALAMPFAYTAHRFARANRYLGLTSGLLSVAFGLFLVYQIGFVDGLFTAHPRWTPG